MDDYKNNIYLEYNDSTMKYNDLTTKQSTSLEPKISFNSNPSKLYTIISIDPDAPSPDNPVNKYHLHMLKINSNQIINPYQGPNPPAGSGIHRYYTCVFEQDYRLEGIKEQPRSKFNLEKFIYDHNLKLVGCFKFRVRG